MNSLLSSCVCVYIAATEIRYASEKWVSTLGLIHELGQKRWWWHENKSHAVPRKGNARYSHNRERERGARARPPRITQTRQTVQTTTRASIEKKRVKCNADSISWTNYRARACGRATEYCAAATRNSDVNEIWQYRKPCIQNRQLDDECVISSIHTTLTQRFVTHGDRDLFNRVWWCLVFVCLSYRCGAPNVQRTRLRNANAKHEHKCIETKPTSMFNPCEVYI